MLGWKPPSTPFGEWQEVSPDSEGQEPQPEKNSEKDTKNQQPQQDGSLLPDDITGPFNRKDISIFQVCQASVCYNKY